MTESRNQIAYTDTKSFAYWGVVLGAAVTVLGVFAFVKQTSLGLGAFLLFVGAYMFALAFLHFNMNGKRTTLTLRDDGIAFEDGLFVPFTDVQKVWAANPFPGIPVDILNIVLHLKPDAPIKQAGRGWKAAFFLTYVGGNISMIGKKKMISFMTPGMRPISGPKQDQDDIIETIFERFDASQREA